MVGTSVMKELISVVEIRQNSQEISFSGASLTNLLKKSLWHRYFSYKFCGIWQNYFFVEHIRTTIPSYITILQLRYVSDITIKALLWLANAFNYSSFFKKFSCESKTIVLRRSFKLLSFYHSPLTHGGNPSKNSLCGSHLKMTQFLSTHFEIFFINCV